MKGVTKTIKNETKEQKGAFLSMLLSTLGASLLGNWLTGKWILRAGSGNKKWKGILRSGSGNNKGNNKGKEILRAGSDRLFLNSSDLSCPLSSSSKNNKKVWDF